MIYRSSSRRIISAVVLASGVDSFSASIAKSWIALIVMARCACAIADPDSTARI